MSNPNLSSFDSMSILKKYNIQQIEFTLFEWDFDEVKNLQIIKLHLKNGEILKLYKDTNYDMAEIFLIDAKKTIKELMKYNQCPFLYFPTISGIFHIKDNSISISGWNRKVFINTQFRNWRQLIKTNYNKKRISDFIQAYIKIKILHLK